MWVVQAGQGWAWQELGRHLWLLRSASPGGSSSAWGQEMIYSPSVCEELNYKGRVELKASLEYSKHSLLQRSLLLCFVSHNSFQLSDSSTRSESRDHHPEKNLITAAPLLTFC